MGVFLAALRRATHDVEAVVSGRSMQGCFADGERIRIRPPGASGAGPPRLGEIAVHLGVDGRLIVHRVVATGRNWRRVPFVITRGDAQTLCDMPVDIGEVQGVVTGVYRNEAWTEPSDLPASRSWRAALGGRIVLAGVSLWARVSDPARRRWFARTLLSASRMS